MQVHVPLRPLPERDVRPAHVDHLVRRGSGRAARRDAPCGSRPPRRLHRLHLVRAGPVPRASTSGRGCNTSASPAPPASTPATAVMKRIERPAGLIRYSTEAEIEGRPRRFWRPRVLVYAALAGRLDGRICRRRRAARALRRGCDPRPEHAVPRHRRRIDRKRITPSASSTRTVFHTPSRCRPSGSVPRAVDTDTPLERVAAEDIETPWCGSASAAARPRAPVSSPSSRAAWTRRNFASRRRNLHFRIPPEESMTSARTQQPWFKHPMVWVVLAPPIPVRDRGHVRAGV